MDSMESRAVVSGQPVTRLFDCLFISALWGMCTMCSNTEVPLRFSVSLYFSGSSGNLRTEIVSLLTTEYRT